MTGLLFTIAALPYIAFLLVGATVSALENSSKREGELYKYMNISDFHRHLVTIFILVWVLMILFFTMTEISVFNTIAKYITYVLMASGWGWVISCINKGYVQKWYHDYLERK